MTDHYKSRASTHSHDCWSWGHGHYECAVREIKALREDAERYRWLRKGASDEVAVVRGLGATDYGIEHAI